MAALSVGTPCQGCTFERGAARENRPTPRPPTRVKRWCLKTSKMLFAEAASEDAALQRLRPICCRPGECSTSNGSINSAYSGCFSTRGRRGAGGEQSAELQSKLFSWAVYSLSLYLSLWACFTFGGCDTRKKLPESTQS